MWTRERTSVSLSLDTKTISASYDLGVSTRVKSSPFMFCASPFMQLYNLAGPDRLVAVVSRASPANLK